MSEELKEITRLCEIIKEKNEEIERLNNIIDKNKYSADELNEIERLNNIIKEVREYIEENWISQKDADNYRLDDKELIIEISDIAVLFDILDKGKE